MRRHQRRLGHVLLADDDPVVRTLAALMLERIGYSVLLASDGQDAVDVFVGNRDRIACVVLDFLMPRLDGARAWRRIQELDPDVRGVIVSGESVESLLDDFGGVPGTRVLAKPYDIEELREAMVEATGSGRAGNSPSGPAP